MTIAGLARNLIPAHQRPYVPTNSRVLRIRRICIVPYEKMCISKNVSVATYVIGMAGAIAALATRQYDVGALALVVVQIQHLLCKVVLLVVVMVAEEVVAVVVTTVAAPVVEIVVVQVVVDLDISVTLQ